MNKKPRDEVLEVTVTFHYIPSSADNWDDEIQQCIADMAYERYVPDLGAIPFYKGALDQAAFNVKRKRWPAGLQALGLSQRGD